MCTVKCCRGLVSLHAAFTQLNSQLENTSLPELAALIRLPLALMTQYFLHSSTVLSGGTGEDPGQVFIVPEQHG